MSGWVGCEADAKKNRSASLSFVGSDNCTLMECRGAGPTQRKYANRSKRYEYLIPAVRRQRVCLSHC